MRKSKIYIKNCSICEKVFVAKVGKTKYCSSKCVNKAGNVKNKKTYNLECVTCNTLFTSSRKRKYCQPKCKYVPNITLKNCKRCDKEFKSDANYLYCSDECSPYRNSGPKEVSCITCDNIVISPKKKCEDCKKKDKLPKIYEKECNHCGKKFKTKRKNKEYCKRGHQPSSVESNKLNKRIRKKKTRKARISTESWSEISDFKKNRPEGFELDHIIPLNHPDVCGLHNTWNFQWLSKEDNNKKSNKFDGTYENRGWKNN